MFVTNNKTLDIVFYTFLFFSSVTIFYVLYFFVKLATHREPTQVTTHQPVSVLICAHNELENLKRLIPFLLQQNYHHFELIIVNDRSWDGTYDYLEIVKLTDSRIKVLHIEETPAHMDHKKFALTLGIKAAKHEILLLSDADCIPVGRNWILQMQAKHQGDIQIVLGASQFQKLPGMLNRFIRFENFYSTILYYSFALRGMAYMGVGRNLSYSKKLYFNNKGFYPFVHITGGDDDLFINRVAQSKTVAVHTSHESQTITYPKTDWSTWFTQKKRHLSVSKYYKTRDKLWLGIFNASIAIFLLCFCILAFQQEYAHVVMGVFVFRLLLLLYLYKVIAKKMGYQLSVWFSPVFDFMYIAYLSVVGLSGLFSKKVKWK